MFVEFYVGRPVIFADYAAEESPSLTFVARTQVRRPLYTSAGKRTSPANIPDNDMHGLLRALVLMTGVTFDSSVRPPEIRPRDELNDADPSGSE